MRKQKLCGKQHFWQNKIILIRKFIKGRQNSNVQYIHQRNKVYIKNSWEIKFKRKSLGFLKTLIASIIVYFIAIANK